MFVLPWGNFRGGGFDWISCFVGYWIGDAHLVLKLWWLDKSNLLFHQNSCWLQEPFMMFVQCLCDMHVYLLHWVLCVYKPTTKKKTSSSDFPWFSHLDYIFSLFAHHWLFQNVHWFSRLQCYRLHRCAVAMVIIIDWKGLCFDWHILVVMDWLHGCKESNESCLTAAPEILILLLILCYVGWPFHDYLKMSSAVL